MTGQRVCELCGVELNEFNRITPESTRCRLCSVGAQADGAILKSFQWFERHPRIDEGAIAGNCVWLSMWRVLATWAIVAACTWAAIFPLNLTTVTGGLVGTFGGVLISMAVIFATAGPLDRLRWQRAWSGIVVGYWVMYLLLRLVIVRGKVLRRLWDMGLKDQQILLLIVAASLLAGLIAAVVNVLRANVPDKATVLMQHQLWRQSRGASRPPTPQPQAQPQPEPQPPPRDTRLPPPLP